uniref:Uncharacterized protein n=1 Tax=Lepeophtheirus salmonis TaxID=72036 RepID=A0A0K2U8T4_LEPSM
MMVHRPFDVAKLSSPLRRETLPIHNVSTPCLTMGIFFLQILFFSSYNQM